MREEQLVSYVGNCDTPKEDDTSEELKNKDNIIEDEEMRPISSDSLVSVGWINIWGDDDLKKRVIEPGERNTRPDQGYKCILNMVGCLKDGTTFDEFELVNIQIGDAESVIGIDLVLHSMNVGEKALVEVSPKFGYGSLGRYPDVPPNEALIYLVELVVAEPEQDLSTYTTSELKEIGMRKRKRGNWWYHERNEPAIALGCYTRALDYLGCEDRSLENSEQQDELVEDRLKVYNNMAAIYLQSAKYDLAMEAIDHVLSRQPHNVKALYRKGKILVAQGKHADALKVLSQAMEIEPEDADIRDEVNEILNVLKSETPEAEELHKEMFGSELEVTIGAAYTETVTLDAVINKTENNETVNIETVSNELVNKDTGTIETLPNTPKTKAKSKSALNLKEAKKRTISKSRFGVVGVFAVIAIAAGLVAYRYKNNGCF